MLVLDIINTMEGIYFMMHTYLTDLELHLMVF